MMPFPRVAGSKLVSLKPIGHGTMWQEAISSLVTRIAHAHTCRPIDLINSEILRDTSIDLVRPTGGVITLDLRTINGVNKYASVFRQRLEDLTLQSGLERSSFLPWSGILDARGCGLLHKVPRWCQMCLKEWREQRREIYFPLIWMVSQVTYCGRHESRLSDLCPQCGKSQPFVPKHTYLEYCSWCKKSLVDDNYVVTPVTQDDEWHYEKYKVEAIEEMLAVADDIQYASFENFQRQIRRAIEAHFSGSTSNLEKIVGFRKKGIHTWLYTDTRPTLPLLLLLFYRLDTTPVKFLRDGLDNSFRVDRHIFTPPPVYKRRKISSLQKIKIRTHLLSIIASKISTDPMSEIAEKMGYPVTFLRYWWPQECIEISNLYRNYQVAQTKKRDAEAVEIAKNIVRELFIQGQKLSRRTIQKRLFAHNILHCWRQVSAAITEEKRILVRAKLLLSKVK